VFTVYDTENDEYSKVEEPDPSFIYTYADYLKWNFEERLELIKGRIFKMSPAPAPFHQHVLHNLNGLLYNFLKKKPCKVYPAPFDVRLPVKNKMKDEEIITVVQPDISIICDESKIDNRGCCGAPDLVIEILSPGNSYKDVSIKFELYQESGVREYWIVYPTEEKVAVFILDDVGKYKNEASYTGNDKIKSGTLPGLIIKVKDVFTK
jgi:Uma2 family endonuclease